MSVYKGIHFNLIGFLACCFTLFSFTQAEATNPLAVKIASGRQASVLLLEGNAYRMDSGLARKAALKVEDQLQPGEIIGTDKHSRIAIKLPDQSTIRFDENTTFKLVAMRYTEQNKFRNININIIIGKTWAKVAKMFKGQGRFELTTQTAVAGVRGTTYRINAYADNSAVVKVYDGEVAVSKKPTPFMAQAPHQVSAPSTVSGPHEIAGPREVSMMEWVHILKAMQQINIQKDGTATKPFNFTLEDDMNDWVQWNLQLDKLNY